MISEAMCSCGAAIRGYSGGFIHCQICHSIQGPWHDFTHGIILTGNIEKFYESLRGNAQLQ